MNTNKRRTCNDEQEARRIAAVKKAVTKHGMSTTVLYRRWRGMKKRCLDTRDLRYKDYGGRGIKISPDWMFFENFYRDMGEGFSRELSLDRIDVDGNYCKENCRWATAKEQQNNMRGNVVITYKGRTQTLHEWAEELDLNPSTVSKRINRSRWSPQRALSERPQKRKERPHGLSLDASQP